MNAIAVSKSRMQNWMEGVTLTGLFHGLPTFVAAAMLIKLFSTSELVTDQGGLLIFVFMATVLHAVVSLGSRRNSRSCSSTITNRCSSTPACPLPTRSRAGAPAPPPRGG
ncbi:MAG: hypothetical protein AB7I42_12655 [Bradyrhizobium sp.]|uniref:hypothetical protein n=1 Tax=Bradyrhizobium sp. TaxID=376 RepID=UPI003D0A0170